MSSVISIRPATVSDVPILAAQRRALFQEIGLNPVAGQEVAIEEHSAAAFTARLARGECFAWLAWGNGGAVGSVALLVFPRLPTPASLAEQEGYLLNVYTDPQWRGRGIATTLVTTAIAKARGLGLARIRLHTTAPGEPVYAAAGFVKRADEMELQL